MFAFSAPSGSELGAGDVLVATTKHDCRAQHGRRRWRPRYGADSGELV